MAKKINPDTPSPTPLSRERVLRTAVYLADEGGIESLSMRKLAIVLGVKAMSLYNHVANKEDILDGMVEIVVSEIEVPSLETDWKTAMRRRGISSHEVLLRHPWATMAMMSRVNIGSAMLRYVDATLGCLHEAGFSFEMADHAWNAIDSYIYGFTLQKLKFPFQTGEYSEVAQKNLSLIPVEDYPYLHQLANQIINGSYSGIHDFEFGLELILNSLDRFPEEV
ncbi:TetR/AcrR family transcriptional regulator C-terminal domain-containing protein [Plectonema cf. radiosum LEGE 06105]|uniref:TetR/AcrR family transcriptional regulator C-terminal domain-containing protein n=1 Tax=Plectonema cf. radiosum LEGE 06105 TaxID=945769 RepID=A0A8J7K1I8_9CYAN|nr:TetR/AcrR family transcriptional regulator C-terminal domain-containing protein [Plectonema radiosum]MBE9214696.1 TetR/AcrR family transcriptional regulator C-terminal domain-containing protein [Plectonema cf. radiosum LEGE 06105]